MAIINNNVQNVKFLRNQALFQTRALALEGIETAKSNASDGTALLARYSGGTVGGSDFYIKTLVGFVAENGESKYLTVFDVEGSSADVEALRQEINAKLGTGITSANTATAQLAALSGNGESTSADTSVEGAKRYADELISELDGSVSANTGYYVKSVSEVDGKISGTTEALPTVATISGSGQAITAVSQSLGEISAVAGDIAAEHVTIADSDEKFTATTVEAALAEVSDKIDTAISGLDYSDTAVAKQFVTEVSETDGVIAVERGTISSSVQTIVLSDNADGGVNFEVNIDNDTIVQDESSKKLKVASAALTQYVGDEDTIQISAVDPSTNTKTISSPLTIQKVTTGLAEEVKEEYHLVGASGNTIGDPVKIYKDSHIVSITYQDNPDAEHYQNLIYTYIDASGATQVAYVDISELVLEAEFASGVTVTNHVAHGVVDPTSETFLTVGADGFKLSGVQDAIDSAVSGLDATVSAETTGGHVTVQIDEEDGKLTAVTLTENNIASSDDLNELSAKTVTEISSSNASISATSAATADGTVGYDIVTDASKIKMSGFTADTSGFTAVTQASTVTEAVKAIETEFIANEATVAAALTDLDTRLDEVSGKVETISGDVDTIKSQYVSGVSVNGNAVTVANHVAPLSISAATSAATASNNAAIVVTTGADGSITLAISDLDAGYYV